MAQRVRRKAYAAVALHASAASPPEPKMLSRVIVVESAPRDRVRVWDRLRSRVRSRSRSRVLLQVRVRVRIRVT